MKPPLWPHQIRAIDQLAAARALGVRRICLAAPTGAGKSRIMREVLEQGQRAALYTHRRMLLEQTAETLREDGIQFGIRASGYDANPFAPVQLCSLQTIDARVLNGVEDLPAADVVLIDEAHQQRASVMEQLAAKHVDAGADLVGFTATPLGIGHLYDKIIVAAYNSELRRCGAHVPALMYAPSEPDHKQLKETRSGDFTESSVRKAMPVKVIFGQVFEHWKRLNPDRKPTILFAPGVPESRGFVQEFMERGVRAAHIDGESCIIDGEECPANQDARDRIRKGSESGEIEVVCNRFVLREGIDFPWLAHGILATAFGSLTSYLQSGGRLLRAHPSIDSVTIQDHGGNWHRHGSLNADRDWQLDSDDYRITRERAERMRNQEEAEPVLCPQCHGVRKAGPKCPHCGYQHTAKVRKVFQIDGTLKEVRGDIYREPKVAKNKPELQRLWEETYWGAARPNAKPCSFNQLRARFAHKARQAGHWNVGRPDPSWPLQPTNPGDWYAKVGDIPKERLTGYQSKAGAA